MRKRTTESETYQAKYPQPSGKDNHSKKPKKKKKKKASSIILNIVLILAIICFLYSGGYLFKYFYTNYKAEQQIHGLEDKIGTENETVEITDGDGNKDYIDARYLKLYEENNDFIGWISIRGTNLSYPVMYTPEDNEYYLHRNFEKEYEYSGLPFIDARCQVKDPSQNIIIYGHNMSSQTMFSTLMKYKDEGYLEKHPTIHFDTIYGSGEYEIAYVMLTNAYRSGEDGFKYYNFIEAADQEEFDIAVKEFENSKIYDTGVDITMEDKLITLSTCEYSQQNGRMVIVARKITE